MGAGNGTLTRAGKWEAGSALMAIQLRPTFCDGSGSANGTPQNFCGLAGKPLVAQLPAPGGRAGPALAA
jgi:hypothetical protein